jgi:hypothetical protein
MFKNPIYMLTKLFAKHPTRDTAGVIMSYLAVIVVLLLIVMSLDSCSVARREGTTSPCYQHQFKASKPVKRVCY